MLHSRKFVLTLVAVVMVMAIAIGSALLKKYLAVGHRSGLRDDRI